MKSNAKSTQSTARKSASSSSRSRNATSVPKSDLSSHNNSITDELDGVIDRTEMSAVESEAGDRVLAETGIDSGEPRDVVPEPELKAITLHQPWASLIANGCKRFETRSWSTNYRGPIAIHAGMKLHKEICEKFGLNASDLPTGAIVAYADAIDCILMTPEFIAAQSETELRCGDWTPGRYAWKLENVRAIEPVIIPGKQGLWTYDHSKSAERSAFEEEKSALPVDAHQNTDIEDLWNQSAAGIGLIYAPALVPVSPMPELSCGVDRPTSSLNGMTIAEEFSDNDSPAASNIAMSKTWTLEEVSLKTSNSLPQVLPVNPSALMEKDSEPTTTAIVSPPSSPQSNNSSPSLQSSRMSPDCLVAPTDQSLNHNPEATSNTSSGNFPSSGTMQNGNVSAAPILERPGVESDSLLLRSPGALSTTSGRPPGQSRLDRQLKELALTQDGEVVAPEFLELGYQLPTGWTNPEETRTAIELSQSQVQQSPTVPSLESPLAMESTAIDVQHSETPSTGELQQLLSVELNTLPDLSNLGSFSKESLIEFASAAHISIGFIERKESDLAMQKLDQARIAGLCLKEFKRKCGHGEFENNLNKNGIAERTAQTYMSIAKDWDIISQASREIIANQRETLSINWATKVISESKRALKSAAPPADPDCWRTPNTREQPIVRLITEALGGEIWCDPCADAGHRIPARVHYNTSNNGLYGRNLWTRTVFINPPFSDPLPWVDKCCTSIARGDCSQAIMLLKAGTLSNQGTGELINKFASGICHWRGRINFLNDHGIAVKGSDFDCVLVYFGDRFDRFQETFETFGTVSFIENHYSSVNKKHFAAAVADKIHSVEAVVDEDDPNEITDSDLDEIAKSLGLDNKKSALFPDKRDSDRALMERRDPNTVDDRPFASDSLASVLARSSAIAQDRFELAKESCLRDYIVSVSSNLSDFSDEQIAFLAKIINEESAKRICGF